MSAACRSARELAAHPAPELSTLGLQQESFIQRQAVNLLERLGRFAEVVPHAERAVELNAVIVRASKEWLSRTADPELGPFGQLIRPRMADAAGVLRGHLREAQAEEPVVLARLAQALARNGRRAEANERLAAAVAAADQLDPSFRPYWDRIGLQLATASLWLDRWADADRQLTAAKPHLLSGNSRLGRTAAMAWERFTALGQPGLAAKWRDFFVLQGLMTELAPPPRPAGVR